MFGRALRTVLSVNYADNGVRYSINSNQKLSLDGCYRSRYQAVLSFLWVTPMAKIRLGDSSRVFKHKLQAEHCLSKIRDDGKIYKVVNEPPGYWSVICIGKQQSAPAPSRNQFREYQKIIAENSRSSSSVFCHRCGGDGGALGNCPRCGGNGLEPSG
jgi:hypothetical protein